MKKLIVYLMVSITAKGFQSNKLLAAAKIGSALSRPTLTAEQIEAIRIGLTTQEKQAWENAKKVSAAGANIDPRDISSIRDKVNDILCQHSLIYKVHLHKWRKERKYAKFYKHLDNLREFDQQVINEIKKEKKRNEIAELADFSLGDSNEINH